MTPSVRHIPAETFHGRRGAVRHAFKYGVDYLLVDMDADRPGPALFSRSGVNVISVLDRDHGGLPGAGRGADWARDVLREHGLPDAENCRVLLLTQPRFFWYEFNPVSFWLVYGDDRLVAVIAEVNNTFGDRHNYLCHAPDFAPITPRTTLQSRKLMHVSPFQDVAGRYDFTFDISDTAVDIKIGYTNGAETLVATLRGPVAPLGNRTILGFAARRPLGALRTTILIHWQALLLKFKGAPYRARPHPPSKEIS